MRKKLLTTLSSVAVSTVLIAVPMMSQASDAALSTTLGTTGVGLHLTVPAMENVNARLGFNYLDYSRSGSTSDVDYDIKMKLGTFDALLDWYVNGSAFRVTGGVTFNNNKIDAVAKSNAAGTYTIQGHTYNAASAGQINGTIDFKKAAPYLGIGWGNALAKQEKGWGFTADLGVLLQGSPSTTLTNTGCTAPSSVCAQLATDVAAENVLLTDKANDFKIYPVARIGVSYRF